MEPIYIEIDKLEEPIRVKQYPIPMEGRKGLKPVIEDLLNKGNLEPCMSRHNTPILAVWKADGSYRKEVPTKHLFPYVNNAIAAMPVDPEFASRRVNGKASKIMKLRKGEVDTRAVEALAKFEEQIEKNKLPYIDYREESIEEWDANEESEED
ncbi:hypothetical protein TURU_008470 [Turdus rufiventris]|nr:hypothetical protein TURU_008470 [Turdus rufiventris]